MHFQKRIGYPRRGCGASFLSLDRPDALKRVRPPGSNKLQIFWKDLFYKNYSLSSFNEKKRKRAIYCCQEDGPALARPAVSTIQNRHRSPDADIRFFSENALSRPSFVRVQLWKTGTAETRSPLLAISLPIELEPVVLVSARRPKIDMVLATMDCTSAEREGQSTVLRAVENLRDLDATSP
jgi:hypothetical protein